jgi:hypothetical protein
MAELIGSLEKKTTTQNMLSYVKLLIFLEMINMMSSG